MPKQELFDTEDLGEYLALYAYEVDRSLCDLNNKDLVNAWSLVKRAERIFVAGNGGSSAIAEHLSCDFAKGAATAPVISLSSNTAQLTAIANDEGYEFIFARKMEFHEAGRQRDLLILISSSGDSPNIIKAAEFAKSHKIAIIGLTGFSGGKLRKMADVSLHIPVDNYGVVEDCHQVLMHVLTQYMIKEKS